jgi:hypothetical protein
MTASGGRSFAVGVNDQTVTVPLMVDGKYTTDMTFNVILAVSRNGVVGQSGQVTIKNTDPQPVQTQTCPDGSVIPVTQTCPVTPPPPPTTATAKCPDGGVIRGGSVCPTITSWVRRAADCWWILLQCCGKKTLRISVRVALALSTALLV